MSEKEMLGYVLSPQQKKVLLLEKKGLHPFIHVTCKCEESIDVLKLKDSLEKMVNCFPILKTELVAKKVDGFPLQRQLAEQPALDTYFEVVDMEQISNQAIEDLRANWRKELASSNVFNVKLLRFSDGDLLEFFFSGLISDSRTAANLILSINTLYRGDSLRNQSEISYFQYASWQHELLSDKEEEAEKFWAIHAMDIQQLPYPERIEKTETNPGVLGYSFLLDQQRQEALDSKVKATGIMSQTIFLAALRILFFHRTKQELLTLGIISDGRKFTELETLPGPLSRTIPIALPIVAGNNLVDWIMKLDSLVEMAVDFEDFLDVNAELELPRLGFEYIRVRDKRHDVWPIQNWEFFYEPFLLKLNVLSEKSQVKCMFDFNPLYYNFLEMEILKWQYLKILDDLCTTDIAKVSEISILSSQERSLIDNFNSSLKKKPIDLVESFLEVVDYFPNEVAVTEGEKSLTYRELHEHTDRLATFLSAERKIRRGDNVIVLGHHSIWSVISIFSLLKLQAVFVPVDPEYPSLRILNLLDEVKPSLILSSEQDERFNDYKKEFLALPEHWDAISQISLNGTSACLPDKKALAYILYTSGSTGKPKGVMVSRNSISNYVHWANQYYFQDGVESTMPLFTSLSFDLTLTSLFTTLTRGDRLLIYRDSTIESMLMEIFDNNSINVVKMTPSHCSILAELNLKSTQVDKVILGGEQIKRQDIELLWALNPEMRIYNEYGPTETTVGSFVKEIKDTFKLSTIGRPIWNTKAFVINGGHLAPIGCEGEIWITGIGVSKGYFKDKASTVKKFTPFGFGDKVVGCYRTGDKGKWLPNGEMQFLGRIDGQLKFKGYRIEPEEIEHVMRTCDGVKDACIILKTIREESHLVGYYTVEVDVASEVLFSFLRNRLPAYMIPTHLLGLKKFPLSINGKLAKNQLPDPANLLRPAISEDEFENETETKLHRVFEEIMGHENLGLTENILNTGISSLKMIKLFNAINAEFPKKIKISDLYNHSTIRELTEVLHDYGAESTKQREPKKEIDNFEI